MYHDYCTEEDNKYSSLRKVYSVNILDFRLFDKCSNALRRFVLADEDTGELLSQELAKQNIPLQDVKFIYFSLRNEKVGHSPNLKHWQDYFLGKEIMPGAPHYIKEAFDLIQYTNLSKEEQRKLDSVQKAIDTHEAVRSTEKLEARKAGFAEGRAAGHVAGGMEERYMNAKKMLEKNISLDIIFDITGLSKDQILPS